MQNYYFILEPQNIFLKIFQKFFILFPNSLKIRKIIFEKIFSFF